MDIHQYADHYNLKLLIADGFDAAVLGVTLATPQRVIYDSCKVIEILMQQGMDESEAWEYFSFNIAGAHVGAQTPIFVCPE